MTLRPYQQKTIDSLYEWFSSNKGNPCIVLPTGAGKSHVIAEICRTALKDFPSTRVLMLCTQKELIEQNAEKLRIHWPNAPIGVYSASMRKKELGEPITFASIQSIKGRITELGHINLVIIDEAHQVNHKDEGVYRSFLSALMPDSIIGLTASPFRMGHGLITDDPAIFTDLIEPVTIDELQRKGFLSKLISKHTKQVLSTEGVHKRGGEFIESELQKAVDIQETNLAVVEETIERAADRKSWLFFCTGIDHSHHIRDILKEKGITAETITGKTPKKEREQIIKDFKEGKIKALTNANVLTTGFDAPNIDLIAFVRPTESPGLYMQMGGRGLRLKDHTDHCLILDFAGVIETHGPINNVRIPGRKSDEPGIPPSKICPECDSIIAAQARICPDCGNVFDIQKQLKEWKLRHDDIMGLSPKELTVSRWVWSKYESRKSKKEMLRVSYYGEAISDTPIHEYLCVLHEGYAGVKGMGLLRMISKESGVNIMDYPDLDSLAVAMTESSKPDFIEYKKEGRYDRIVNRVWDVVPF
jgi:DNA repair protein RadD